jgi:DNA-binding beta-propeller fold protein YncE
MVLLTSLLVMITGCSSGPVRHKPPALTLACATRTDPGRLSAVPAPRAVSLPGHPFAAVALPGGRQAVASLTVAAFPGDLGELAVLAVHGQAASLARIVTLPRTVSGAEGMALTPDGRWLLVAAQAATAVLSVAALEHGSKDPVAGVLSDAGAGQSEVAVSGDGRYAFVTDETSGGLSVFDLALARRKGYAARGVAVGIVPLARGPVGVATAPGGVQLYVTTLGGYGDLGRLWVVGTREAEDGAGRAAVLGNVAAGCQPVRVAVSPGGGTVWVTALQSNALLGYSAAALDRRSSLETGHRPAALRAVVPVGSEPVGLLLLDGGRTALVSDSNRGLVPGTGGGPVQRVSVVSTAAALAGRPAVTGSLPAGQFPRDLGYDAATGEVLIPDYISENVEIARVPEPG